MAGGNRQRLAALTIGAALALAAAGCGGAGDDGARVTTTSPASAAAGREVCEGFFADLEILPRLQRAREAGPRLGQIFQDLAELRAQQDAGEVTGEVLLERVRSKIASLEIVCADDFGVTPPPGYTKRSAPPG